MAPTEPTKEEMCACGSGDKADECCHTPDKIQAREAKRKEIEVAVAAARKKQADEQARAAEAERLYKRAKAFYTTSPPNYKSALPLLLKAADLGSDDSEYMLGIMHQNAYGMRQDLEKAVMWYRRAAEHGYEEAMFNLGTMLFHGSGTKKNPTESVKWLKKSGDLGYTPAQSQLANIYMHGHGGVPKDRTAALILHMAAAEAGDKVSIAVLSDYELRAARAGGDQLAAAKADKAMRKAYAAASGRLEHQNGAQGFGMSVSDRLEELKLSRQCDACGKTEEECNDVDKDKLRCCGGCRLAKYCSVACQTSARPAHKAACLVEVAARKARKGKGKA